MTDEQVKTLCASIILAGMWANPSPEIERGDMWDQRFRAAVDEAEAVIQAVKE